MMDWKTSLLTLALVLYADGFSKYGRTCKDIGCLNSEVCVLADDPCPIGHTRDCGTYPTCKKKTAVEGSHAEPQPSAPRPTPARPQLPSAGSAPNYPPPAPPAGGSPYGGSPYGGSSPYGNNNGGGSPYGNNNGGGSPYGNNNGGGSPYGGNPYGGNSNGGSNYPGGSPYGGNPYGGSSNPGGSPYGGHSPYGGNSPYGGSTGNRGGYQQSYNQPPAQNRNYGQSHAKPNAASTYKPATYGWNVGVTVVLTYLVHLYTSKA
ncbi:uncharacterized protein isoform X2 [Choristoneura fumiferana]|uniref:uncharacterized protein isoform X2 n=1 Tax=Choristoneura fumiferana TaxID=7141 RepID=UPI003D1593E2